MTAVFVHGVPETVRVWEPLVSHLERTDVALLALPAFGSARPEGFDATMDTYAAWLADELTAFDEVDLVSHDWGGLLSLRVLADQPANVRSWVSDMGDLDPTFEWHDTAKTWQTPGDGEALMEAFLGASLADRAAILEGVSAPQPGATVMAEHLDRTMADAILDLYRSATDIGNEWGPGVDRINAPGLLIQSMNDPFRNPARVQTLADRTNAEIATLADAGHFWMLDDPEGAAQLITDFWESRPGSRPGRSSTTSAHDRPEIGEGGRRDLGADSSLVGDLGVDTAVEPVDAGRYTATLSRDWEIWGPMGGYVASVALRAAGTEAGTRRPTSFSCHYFGVAAFEPVDITVETRKPGRVAMAQRVSITQGDRAILDAIVWSTLEVEGLEHDEVSAPDVPGPDDLPSAAERAGPDSAPPFPFWENFDSRPLDWISPWPPTEPHAPHWRNWLQFAPTRTFDDPWVDACRSVILVDLPSWPAGHRPTPGRTHRSSPDAGPDVAFHRPANAEPWLLCDGSAPLSTGGLLPWNARVWSTSGQLLASGGGQCLYRRTTPPS